MPEKSETLVINGYDGNTLQLLALGTLHELGWTIKYAGDDKLLAYTPRKWNKRDHEITITSAENQLTINSKMIHGELTDISGRNRNYLEQFTTTFHIVKAKSTFTDIDKWNNEINILKEETIKEAEKEILQAEEVDSVMNLSRANLGVTYGIIGTNVLVFIIMVADGANFFAPRPMDVLKWGASLPLLDLSGEWWRAFTSMFLHFGIIHLALNIYALYMVSIYLEPMLGKARYIAAYLCSGMLASLLSIVWHKNDLIVSAGASGAVFGMYGVFLALLTTSIIPKHVRKTMLKSILIFVAYNVFYGFKPGSGVNNAAHLGGLVSGMLIGYIYYFSFKEPTPKKTFSIVAFTVVVTIMLLITVFQNEKTTPIKVNYATGEIYESTKEVPIEYDRTNGQYEKKIKEFYALEKKALAPDNDSASTPEQLIERYKQESLPTWDEAGKIVDQLKELANTTAQKKDITILTEYIDLRRQWTYLQIRRQHDNSEELITEITELVIKINALFEPQTELH